MQRPPQMPRKAEIRVWVLLYKVTREKSVVISLCSSEQSAHNIFNTYKKSGSCDPRESEFWIPYMTLHSVRLDNVQDDVMSSKNMVRMDDRAYCQQQRLIWERKRAELLSNKRAKTEQPAAAASSSSYAGMMAKREEPRIASHFQPGSSNGLKRKLA